MTDEEIENSLRQPILKYIDNIEKERLKSEKFIFNYLTKKGGKGKIDNLLLKVNGIDLSVKYFLESIEFYTKKTPLIKILKQSKDKATLELTLSGELFYKDNYKIEVKIPSLLLRLKVCLRNTFNILWIWLEKFDKKVQKFWKSGIMLVIVFIIGNLTKIDFFNSKSNNQKETQQIIDTIRKLKYFQTFSDSLLREIEQKEKIIKEYKQAQKESILTHQNDSLKKK
ncbi:hypothetical protein [Polaribacter sp. R77954]|uniref:hypothetical protein n=1 Tax=Polaribacter sp. R77954 TaxID=3093870 RepID=UPI0037C5EC28